MNQFCIIVISHFTTSYLSTDFRFSTGLKVKRLESSIQLLFRTDFVKFLFCFLKNISMHSYLPTSRVANTAVPLLVEHGEVSVTICLIYYIS